MTVDTATNQNSEIVDQQDQDDLDSSFQQFGSPPKTEPTNEIVVDDDQQGDDLSALVAEASGYGFSPEFLEGLPAEKISQLMSEFDSRLLVPPTQFQGMNGGYQQQQQQQPLVQQQQFAQQQQSFQQQQQPANEIGQQPTKNDWSQFGDLDDETRDILDHVTNNLRNEFSTQFQQINQQLAQAQAQPLINEFNNAVDSLKQEVFGSGTNISYQQNSQRQNLMQMVVSLAGGYEQRGMRVPPVAELVKRAHRATGNQYVNSGELLDKAKQRNAQIIGTPAKRSSRPTDPHAKANAAMDKKLQQLGINPADFAGSSMRDDSSDFPD